MPSRPGRSARSSARSQELSALFRKDGVRNDSNRSAKCAVESSSPAKVPSSSEQEFASPMVVPSPAGSPPIATQSPTAEAMLPDSEVLHAIADVDAGVRPDAPASGAGESKRLDTLLSALSDAESVAECEVQADAGSASAGSADGEQALQSVCTRSAPGSSTWCNPLAAEARRGSVPPPPKYQMAAAGEAPAADAAAPLRRKTAQAVLPSLVSYESESAMLAAAAGPAAERSEEIKPQSPLASTPTMRRPPTSAFHGRQQSAFSPGPRAGGPASPGQLAAGSPAQWQHNHGAQMQQGQGARWQQHGSGAMAAARLRSMSAPHPSPLSAAPCTSFGQASPSVEELQQQNAMLVHRLEATEEALHQVQSQLSQMSIMSNSCFTPQSAMRCAPPATHGSVMTYSGMGGSPSLLPAGSSSLQNSTMFSSPFVRTASLGEQNEQAAALHSTQVNWPDGPSRHGKSKLKVKTGGKVDSRTPSIPRTASLPNSSPAGKTGQKEGKKHKARKGKRAEKGSSDNGRKDSKSPNGSHASTTNQSLNVESLSQESVGGGSVEPGPMELPREPTLGALVEGGSSTAVAMAAQGGDAAAAASGDAALLASDTGDGATGDAAMGNAAPDAADGAADDSGSLKKKGGLRGLFQRRGESSLLKDGVGRDRQVVNLLGGGADLTHGKGAAFGVSAARGNEVLLHQDASKRAAALLKARKQVEVERGGLFSKGAIAEHAPVGKRKFRFRFACV